ncbi:DUF3226 domain-containing protein [Thermococcus sp.]
MDVRLLILEGKTDVSFFLPILRGIYGFSEDKRQLKDIPIGKHRSKDTILSTPIALTNNNILLIVYHTGGKDNFPKALKNIIHTLDLWEERLKPSVIGVVRDADTSQNVINWLGSILREFNPLLEKEKFKINDIRIIPFALGDIKVENPYIRPKRELELMLVELASKESTLTNFSRSIQALSNDKKRPLTPKDVMHVLAIAKDFDGDSLSGLYRKFMEELIRTQRSVFVSILKESRVIDFLEQLTR